MNPVFVIPFLVYTILAVMWPAQVDGRRRGGTLLLVELLIVSAALVLGYVLGGLVTPRAAGLIWGKIGFYAAVYLYVCGRGIIVVRGALEVASLHLRRDEDRTAGGIELARNRAIGLLERGLVLTFVLMGEYTVVGLVLIAMILSRFRSLDDREYADYFVISTMASFLLAVAGGAALKVVL